MTGHILTPDVHLYGLTIAIILCLAVHSLTTHLRDTWLARWKQLEFWHAHILAMVLTVTWASVAMDPIALFTASPLRILLSLPIGLGVGWVAVRIDHLIARRLSRRSLHNKTRESAGQRRNRMSHMQQAWTVRPVGSAPETEQRKNERPRVDKPRSSAWILVGIAVLEEIIFRGFLVQACFLLEGVVWTGLALLGTAAVFALAHVQFGWSQVISKVPLAVLTLVSVLCLDTVIPAILIHATFNWSIWNDTDGDLRTLFRISYT